MIEILRKGVQDALQGPVPAPLLEVAMARLVRRVAAGHVGPLGSRAKNPQHPMQDLSQVLARTTLAVLAPPILRQQRSDELPLGVCEIHGTSPQTGGRLNSGRFTRDAAATIPLQDAVSRF